MIYINPYLSMPINTIIGGVASSISTKSALATKLAISESIIKRFEIVGSDVRAHITTAYNIPNGAFLNDANITSYIDLQAHVSIVSENSLRNTNLNSILFPALTGVDLYGLANTKLTTANLSYLTYYNRSLSYNALLETIYLPSLEGIPIGTSRTDMFGGLTSCNLIDMRKLKNYGSNSTGYTASGSGFANLKTGCEIRVHIALATANSGAVNEALRYAKTVRGAIVKFYDDNGDYVSTL